ncbi:MAG: diguanylate cyclase [FCB group bacterium]|nr:diguanylate cyclase [FCB group bacterium]
MDFGRPLKRRILTIDDNEDIHRDFAAVLLPPRRDESLDEMEAALFGTAAPKSTRVNEYEIEHALQGEDGVKKISKALHDGNPYALAFVDMRMPPGLDGAETIRQIWRVDPDVQIVICTAYSDYDWTELQACFRQTDSLLILKKPFAAEEVVQLASALTEKWVLSRRAALKMEELERLVRERTAELAEINAKLTEEVVQRKASEEMLRKLSLVDGLTGIPNRRVFDETLETQWAMEMQKGTPVSLLMIDLDYFKQYNDCNGHPAGDECLKRVAQALYGSTARRWDLVARYGGEEFAAILPDTNQSGAVNVAQAMLAAVEALAIPHADSRTCPIVTVSIGCASLTPSPDITPQALIAAADRALYRAKGEGRNQIACLDDPIPA